MTLAGEKIKKKPFPRGLGRTRRKKRSGVRLDWDKWVFVRWHSVNSFTRKFVELSSLRARGVDQVVQFVTKDLGRARREELGGFSGLVGNGSCRFGSRRSERRIVKSGELSLGGIKDRTQFIFLAGKTREAPVPAKGEYFFFSWDRPILRKGHLTS